MTFVVVVVVVVDAGGDEHTGAVLRHQSSGVLQQCTDWCQQSVANTEDAGDTERRSSFHHWSQEVRAHDASVTRPSLATSTAKDQVQDGRTGIQVSSWHGSTIPDIILP